MMPLTIKNKRKETKMSKYKKYNRYHTNGLGERIHNPEAYYRAVAEDRYGYRKSKSSSYKKGWNDGYSYGYADGYTKGKGGW